MIRFRSLVLCVCVCAFASTARAQTTTALFLDSQPGDFIGGGVQQTYHDGDGTKFTAARNYDAGVSATAIGPSYAYWWYLDFAAGNQQPLTAGTLYTAARRFPLAALNALSIDGTGRGCNTLTGRFLVREAVYNTDGSLAQFAVDFEQHCENSAAALFGSFRYQSTIADLTPFGGDYPHVRLTIAQPTNGTITGSGLNCGSTGSVCVVDFGSTTSVALTATPDPGYLFAGWSGDCSGDVSTSVSVNGAKDCGVAFQPITLSPGSSRTLLWLDSQAGDPVGQGQRRVFSPLNSRWSAPVMSSSGSLSMDVDGVSATSDDNWSLLFAALPNTALAQGTTYTHALATQTPFTPAMQVGSCFSLNGRFTVLELVRATDGTVLRLAIDFEEHCNAAGPALFGSLRYNSTVSDILPFGGSYPVYTLTVNPAANGVVTGSGINCGGAGAACSGTYAQPTTLALTATPASGYIFTGWSGDCTGSAVTTILVNSAITCSAIFELLVPSGPRTLARWTSQTIDYGVGPKTDTIGGGVDGVFSPQASVWNVQSSDGVSISASVIWLSGTSTSSWTMAFAPPPGQVLTPGAIYVHATPFARTRAVMSFSRVGGGFCGSMIGRFLVRDIAFNTDKSVARLAIDFEMHCGLAVPALIGIIRYNSAVASVDPFDGDYNVYRVTIVPIAHGHVVGSGLNCGLDASTCVIQPGVATTPAFSAVPDPGFAFAGWTGDCHGGANTTLFVNGPKQCAALFELSPGTTIRTFLRVTSDPGDLIGQGRSELYTLSNSALSTPFLSAPNGYFQANVTGPNDTGEDSWSLTLNAPVGQSLQVGRYDVTTTSFSSTAPRFSFFGPGSCSAVGSFTIRDLAVDTNGNTQRFAVDFEMHCGTMTAPALRGTYEYASTADVASLAIDRSALRFAIVRSPTGVIAVGSAQAVHVTQSGPGQMLWSATSNVPWLTVTPSAYTGSATLMVGLNPGAAPQTFGASQGTVSIKAADGSLLAGPIAVTLTTIADTAVRGPFGSFDTPLDGTAGMSGSIGVTGWALDDVEVTQVRILRDPVAPESAGALVFIGNATLVDGARPDVAGLYPQMPRSTRAGWGYLLLTNMLPNQGNGTFRLYAYADGSDGHSTLLGTKTITVDNAHATAPFGAIDTPGQGDVVSGVVANFGWVLSKGSTKSDPPGGGTVTVYVDGAPVGSPAGWTHRDDLSALFPSSQYSGVDSALGVYGLDTTKLTNGVHTIAWAVTDNLGVSSGIGSRFFTVSNGSILVTAPSAAQALSADTASSSVTPGMGIVLLGRRGFDPDAPLQYYFPDRSGVVVIDARELDRIELELEPGATGVMLTPRGERPLPAGAQIDRSTGLFTWAPGPGFVGSYELILGGNHVRIVLRPKTD